MSVFTVYIQSWTTVQICIEKAKLSPLVQANQRENDLFYFQLRQNCDIFTSDNKEALFLKACIA